MDRKTINQKDLNKLIENHLLWINSSQSQGEKANLSNLNLKNIDLKNFRLNWADLTGVNLSGSDLTEADLTGANLSKADLTGANLTGANLSRAKLIGANLSRTNLKDSDLTGADLTGANLRRSNLRDSDLTGANLTGANLSRAKLIGANLRDSDLTEADLTDVNLRRSNLRYLQEKGYKRIAYFPPGYKRKSLVSEKQKEVLVNIALYDEDISLETQEEVVNAVGELMEALGFKYKEENEPVFGSFYQDLWFEFTTQMPSELVSVFFNNIKKIFNKEKSNDDIKNGEKILDSLNKVIKSIKDTDNAIIRVGQLILIKRTVDNISSLIIESISKEIAHELDKNPELLINQDKLISYLQNKGIVINELKDKDKKVS